MLRKEDVKLFRRFCFFLPALVSLCLPLTVRADSVVVFNEVMYHPLTNETAMEWLELRNQMAVDVDIPNWSLQKGVQFTFPEGTVIPGGGYLVAGAVAGVFDGGDGTDECAGAVHGPVVQQRRDARIVEQQ